MANEDPKKKPADVEEEELDEEEDDDEDEDEEEDDEDEEGEGEGETDEDEEDDDEDEEDDDEDEEDDDDEEDAQASPHPPPPGHAAAAQDASLDQEPGWWIPHVVLGGLILLGVLGFFGFLSPIVNKLASKKEDVQHTTHGSAEPASTTAAPATAAPTQKPKASPATASAKVPDPDPTFGAKRLVVHYKGAKDAKNERSKADAKARAEEALKKIKDGAKFEDVAGEYSDEPGAKTTGGNLGNFKRRVYDATLEETVERTNVGDTSQVFESPYGYEIIQRTK